MKKLVLFLFLVLPFCQSAKAQCIDSTMIQYGAYCDPRWEPVCGCDGLTYRNDCFTRNLGMTTWQYGICDALDFDFNPNPVFDFINIDAILRIQGTLYVELVDRFGRVYYRNLFPSVTRYQFQISVNGFPPGLYLLNLYCDDGYRVKKVVIPER